MLKDFKAFVLRGNVLDMAVGVIIGASFGKIVTSLVNDVLMPPLGLLMGKVDFSSLFYAMDGKEYASLADLQKAGAPALKYGLFVNTVLDFVIVAFVIFLLIRGVTKLLPKPPPPPSVPPSMRDCPFCLSAIPMKATRCGHCTSEVKPA